MKAIQVTHLLSGKLQAKAEGVPAIRRSREALDDNNPKLDIATQLCNKYDWLTFNGVTKYRLQQAFLPNGDDVFVFVELPPKEPVPDIRRDLRLLLEKYDARLVAVDYTHQPSSDITIRLESAKTHGRDVLIELDYSVTDCNAYELSEEAIADV